MALNQLPDFSYKGEVPFASIVQAYQQKAQQEEQMRMNQEALKQQKINNVKDIFTQGAGLVDNLMKYNKQSQIQDAQNALTSLLGRGAEQVPTGQMTPASSSMVPQLDQASLTQDYSKTPGYKAELASLVTKAFPDEAGKEAAKAAFGQLNPSASQTGRQQVIRYSPTSGPNKGQSFIGFADPNGKAIYNQNGDLITEPVHVAYAYGFGEDPGTGAIVSQNRSSGEVRTATTPSQASFNDPELVGKGGLEELKAKAPKIAAQVEKIREESFPQTNKTLETQITGATAAAQVRAILEAEGEDMSEVGLQSLGFYFARMSGSNSQLSNEEREIFESPLSLISKVTNKGYRIVAGDLSPKMRNDLKNLSRIIEKKASLQAKKYLNSNKRRAQTSAGRYWNKSIDESFPTYEELVVSTNEMLGIQQQEDELNALLKGILED